MARGVKGVLEFYRKDKKGLLFFRKDKKDILHGVVGEDTFKNCSSLAPPGLQLLWLWGS